MRLKFVTLKRRKRIKSAYFAGIKLEKYRFSVNRLNSTRVGIVFLHASREYVVEVQQVLLIRRNDRSLSEAGDLHLQTTFFSDWNEVNQTTIHETFA